MPKLDFGKLGRSMSVSSAGVGAIYDLRVSPKSLESVMIAGLEFWKEKGMPVITEPQLARNLGVTDFRGVPEIPDDQQDSYDLNTSTEAYVPAVRFPAWLECQECHRIGTEKNGDFQSKRGGQPKCTANYDKACKGRGLPVRLIVSCHDPEAEGGHPGHVGEFPWRAWAHSSPGQDRKACSGGDLFLESSGGKSITLAGLSVVCRGCNSKRSLKDVFRGSDVSRYECKGRRPWLGSSGSESCGRSVRPLMRGASNVYFPVVASAISIPPFSDRLVSLLSNYDEILRRNFIKSGGDVFITFARQMIPDLRRYSDSAINEAMRYITGAGHDNGGRTDSEQRAAEHTALVNGSGSPGDDFIAELVDFGNETRLGELVEKVVKVPVLREVRALRGFNRIKRVEVADPYKAPCAPISGRPLKWLPAIEIRGEGVYVELDSDRIAAWEHTDVVRERVGQMRNNVKRALEQDRRDFHEAQFPSAGEILVHTLSHLLINQLTLDCGYSTASLRERLYFGRNAEKDFFGFLIYTGTHGADGTLGGLVRQGDPERMEATLFAALDKARWCASDPICMESTGQGPNATNMAACHACCVVSETSCEKGNQFLDRGFLVGEAGKPGLGFFEGTGD